MADKTLHQGHVDEQGRVFLGYVSKDRLHGRWGTQEELDKKRDLCRKHVAESYARKMAARPPKPPRPPKACAVKSPRVLLTEAQKAERRRADKKAYRTNLRRRLRTDPVLRLLHNSSRRVGQFIRGQRAEPSAGVGCSREVFQASFEALFSDGMCWDNYGQLWHVDHIVPRSWFKRGPLVYRSMLNHVTNLRPLLGDVNAERADTMSIEDFSLALRRAPDEHRDWIHHLAQLNADRLEKRGADFQPTQGPEMSITNHLDA